MSLPVLYSFRRCPYAMRARLALKYSALVIEVREVLLKDKPSEMLEASPKGTVPVLLLPDGRVIAESLDIMFWALQQADAEAWLDDTKSVEVKNLVELNDGDFKQYLDQYKYFDRYPAQTQQDYRQLGERFLQKLEGVLSQNHYLFSNTPGFTDMAIFPFIRQFAQVDREWFYASDYVGLQSWLKRLLESPLFISIMKKYPRWQREDTPIYL